jgi:uncharacterized protein YkwD
MLHKALKSIKLSEKVFHVKIEVLLLFLILITTSLKAQNSGSSYNDSIKVTVDLRTINLPFLERIITTIINQDRQTKGLNELTKNSILNKTAIDQALFMADFATMEQSNPGERAIAYGGTRNLSEIIGKASISPTKKTTYLQAAQLFTDKWESNAIYASLLFNKNFTFMGVSVAIDPIGEKFYATVDLGDKNSIAPILDKSASKYISSKFYGLQLYNAKACSKCNKFSEINELAQHIVLEDNNVYFVYDNLKKIKQLLKTPLDGFAIDLVNKNQFSCDKENIVNYQVPNKGIMLKPVIYDDIFRLNTEDPKSNKLKVKLGSIPKEISIDSVELNLIVISQGIVCKNLYKTNVISQIESKPYVLTATYLTDPGEYYPFDFKKKNVQKKEIDSVCVLAQNPRFLSNVKLYNCLAAYVMNDFPLNDGDADKMSLLFDKMKVNKKEKLDTLQLLEISFLMNIVKAAQTSQNTKDIAMNKLKAIEPYEISFTNVLALYSFFVNHNEYQSALSWLDDVVLSELIPEDYLFSYISISTLYSERVNSGSFSLILNKAKTLNAERFCNLFKPKNFSFQIFENQSIKSIICESCRK